MRFHAELAVRTTARANVIVRSAREDENSPNEYPKAASENGDKKVKNMIRSLLLCERTLTTLYAVSLRNLNTHVAFLLM
jgi:hypothetical protein